jgi:hypothetical protein
MVMPNVKIWDIIEGPISIEDLPEDEEYPEDCKYLSVVRAEIDGKMENVNYWFEDFEDAYEWSKYFEKNIEPLVINYNELYYDA